jgi:hypothetical protein
MRPLRSVIRPIKELIRSLKVLTKPLALGAWLFGQSRAFGAPQPQFAAACSLQGIIPYKTLKVSVRLLRPYQATKGLHKVALRPLQLSLVA